MLIFLVIWGLKTDNCNPVTNYVFAPMRICCYEILTEWDFARMGFCVNKNLMIFEIMINDQSPIQAKSHSSKFPFEQNLTVASSHIVKISHRQNLTRANSHSNQISFEQNYFLTIWDFVRMGFGSNGNWLEWDFAWIGLYSNGKSWRYIDKTELPTYSVDLGYFFLKSKVLL